MEIFGMSLSYVLFTVLHVFQFAIALAVCALYGMDLNRAQKAGKYMDGKWVFAVVVGGLSALTSLLYMAPFILRFAAVPIWSFIIMALYIALFGLFGSMYINEDPEGVAGVRRMKNAVWVDLAGLLLWFIGTAAAAAYWWTHRERHSRFTGRAKLGRNVSIRTTGWGA